MKCGVRFCGGCNPKYDRGETLQQIKEVFPNIAFVNAQEGQVYDRLLVIGGCHSCCASYGQFESKEEVLKMWDPAQTQHIIDEMKK